MSTAAIARSFRVTNSTDKIVVQFTQHSIFYTSRISLPILLIVHSGDCEKLGVTNNTGRCYIQVLSTCPLHTNSGCGKERRILSGPWWPSKAALVRNYLEIYWPCAGGISAVNAIGTQLRDPINSD